MKPGWAYRLAQPARRRDHRDRPGPGVARFPLQTGRDLSDSPLLLAVIVVILGVGIVIDTVFFGRLERYVRHRYGLEVA
jgi:hypothetical protein